MDNRTNQAWTERLKGENKIERSFSRTIKAMSRPKPAAKLQISESLAYCATTRARSKCWFSAHLRTNLP